MPSVMDYEEVKTSFPRVFDFVSGANGTVVTIKGKVNCHSVVMRFE